MEIVFIYPRSIHISQFNIEMFPMMMTISPGSVPRLSYD